MELEQGKNVDFWRDMTIITEDEIAKLRKLEASGKGGPGKWEGRAWCGCQRECERWVEQGVGSATYARAPRGALGGGCGSGCHPLLGPSLLLSGAAQEGLGEGRLSARRLTGCPRLSVQGNVGMASTPLSAQTCSPCSRGRRTTSCKCCTRASRARSGQEDPTLTLGTGRACCSS